MPAPRSVEAILTGCEPARRVNPAWDASPWSWLRTLPPAAKGAVGVQLVRAWLTEHGSSCTAAAGTDADLVADGVRIEVKLSCEWADGTLRFQQLRDQDWDVLVAVGVQPQKVRLWVLEKAMALELATGQHTGSEATETSWLCWPAATAPAATGSAEGDPAAAAKRFADLRRRVRLPGDDPGSHG